MGTHHQRVEDDAHSTCQGVRGRGRLGLLLEYEIPRRDRRIDVVLLAGSLVIVLEFKTGDSGDEASARRQTEHYALELRDFPRESRGLLLVPVVISRGVA